MKREIKFKFWLGHTKKITYAHSIAEIHGIIPEFTDDIIPLQFTGLQDKNGIDIYEGDVLQNHENKKGIVVFYDGGFKLQIYKGETSAHYISMNEGYCLNKTIIGNIYENPELLTHIN